MAQIPSTLVNGLRFVGNACLTEAHTTAEYVEQRRSWAERIFETPWHPFKATKTVTKYTTVNKPSRQIYRVKDVYYAHPEMIKEMVEAIDKGNEAKP